MFTQKKLLSWDGKGRRWEEKEPEKKSRENLCFIPQGSPFFIFINTGKLNYGIFLYILFKCICFIPFVTDTYMPLQQAQGSNRSILPVEIRSPIHPSSSQRTSAYDKRQVLISTILQSGAICSETKTRPNV